MSFKVKNGANVGYTTAERDSFSSGWGVNEEGTIIYNETTDQTEVWSGSAWVAVGGGGGSNQTLSFSSPDLTISSGNTIPIDSLNNPKTSYNQTYWVDVNGSASYSGQDPSYPTTFANAMTNAAFGDLILLSEGIYTTGGAINISVNNLTIKSLQGGTGSNSVIISDNITIGAGVTRFRCTGIRFDGTILDNGSDGRHYFDHIALGGSAVISRLNPQRWMQISDSDLSSGVITVSGVGSNTAGTTISGSTTQTSLQTLSATNHTFTVNNNAISGRVDITEGTLAVNDANFSGLPNVINGGVNSTVILNNVRILDLLQQPQQITLAGNYVLLGVLFDKLNSTLTGTEIITNTVYYSGAISSLRSQDIKTTQTFSLNGSVNSYNSIIFVDNTLSAIDVTLPEATFLNRGSEIFMFFAVSPSLNNVTLIAPDSSHTINGVTATGGVPVEALYDSALVGNRMVSIASFGINAIILSDSTSIS